MARLIRVKRGDSWSITGTRTDSAGDPVSLSGVTIAAQMKNGSVTIDLVAAATDAAAGEYELSKAANPDVGLGVYQCDVEFTTAGVVASSETFLIVVEEDITNAD